MLLASQPKNYVVFSFLCNYLCAYNNVDYYRKIISVVYFLCSTMIPYVHRTDPVDEGNNLNILSKNHPQRS